MRILQLNPFYLPYNGGIEKRIAAFSSRYSGRHQVFVLTSRLPGTVEEETVHGAKVIRLPSRYFGSYNPPYVNSDGIGEALDTIGPDIIDYHYRWSRSYNSAFFGSSVPRVMTFHNLYGEGTGLLRVLSILNDSLFVKRLRNIDHIMPVSGYIRQQLLEKGISDSMLTTSYNGVDPHSCVTTDERFALFIGRLVPTKGLGTLVRAAVASKVPLKIAGSGPMLEKLRKVCRGHDIEILGGVSEEQKEKLLSSCSFMVLPSLQEAFGIAALEGMMHSKPVIASDAGGLPEVVGEAGIVVRRGDAAMLAGAMKTYWNDKSLLSEKGELARKRAAEFSWDRTAGLMDKVYSSVLESAA